MTPKKNTETIEERPTEAPEAIRPRGSRPQRRLLVGAALGLCSAVGLTLSLLLLTGNANLPLTGSADMPGASPSTRNATLAQTAESGDADSPAAQDSGTAKPASEDPENAASSENPSFDEDTPEDSASSKDGEVHGTSNSPTDADGPSGPAGTGRSGGAAASGGTSNAAASDSGNHSAPSTPSPSSGSAGTPNPSGSTPSPTPASIAVSLVVDSSAANSLGFPATMASGTLELPEGATAYDALAAAGLSLEGSASYVSAVNGLAEKMMGGGSGWTYTVNGAMPMTAAGNYTLHEGDVVRWVYVN